MNDTVNLMIVTKTGDYLHILRDSIVGMVYNATHTETGRVTPHGSIAIYDTYTFLDDSNELASVFCKDKSVYKVVV